MADANSRRDYINAWRKANRLKKNPSWAEKSRVREIEQAACDAAINDGKTFFESIRPCRLGHVGLRSVVEWKCAECNKIACRAKWLKKIGKTEADVANELAAKAAATSLRAAKRTQREAVISARAQAIANGDKTYLGKTCQFGHDGVRYTTGNCVQCSAIYAASKAKKEYDRKYFDENADKIKERTRLYFEKNRERAIERGKRWAGSNKDRVKAIKTAYKSRRRAQVAGGDSTRAIHQWEIEAKKVCYWCGVSCKKKYHIDHYQPLSKGGRHEVANLVIACPGCNLRKSAKDPYQFAGLFGRLF